jgi:hypothetical protein
MPAAQQARRAGDNARSVALLEPVDAAARYAAASPVRTGTDTEIGKTAASTALLHALAPARPARWA